MKEDMCVKYFVWKNDERFDDIGYNNYEEAFKVAIENDCDDIEETIWYSRDSYNNYNPADEFKTVWKK